MPERTSAQPMVRRASAKNGASNPVTWCETTLGEILPLKYGKARSRDVGYPQSETQTFGSNGVFGTFDRAITEGPSIIVGRKGAAGLVHYSTEPCWPIDTAFYTEGSDKTYLPFFRYLLESLRLGQFDRSTAIPSLSRDDYNARKIAYPERLETQRQIVAEIEKQFTRLDAGVAALRRVQANLKRHRAAVLKAACEGHLVPTEAELAGAEGRAFETGERLLARILADRRKNWHGRGKYKEPAAPDTTSLMPLPEGWAWASLEQLAWSSSYGTSTKCNYDNAGPPVLRIPNITAGRIDASDMKFAGSDFSIADGEELASGDLLIIRTNGSRDLIGRSTVVKAEPERSTSYASYLIRFRLWKSRVLFDWIGAVWDVPFLRGWVEQRAATSAGQHNISMSVLSGMPIPLPSLAEQTRIVAEVERRLSVIEELEASVAANLQGATRLRQSILQRAFTTNR